MTHPTAISDRGLRRLPVVLSHLKELRQEGVTTVTCTPISERLGCDATQIRKDLAACGAVGRPRTGYEVQSLIQLIERFLGWTNVSEAFLAGAGNLGSALLGFDKFRTQQGLNIVAAFDTDPEKLGTTIHGVRVLALDKLSGLARRMHVRIGILAVPERVAQSVADSMIAGGMRALWNFTPRALEVPDGVVLENADLSVSLGVLTAKLQRMLEQGAQPPASRHGNTQP